MRYVICVALLGTGCGRSHLDAYYAGATGGSSAATGTLSGTSTGTTGTGPATSGTTSSHTATGTSGATSTGSSTSGCMGQGVGEELSSCAARCSTCMDGQACDPATLLCERQCETSAACPLLGTACSPSGFCEALACSPTISAGGAGGVGAPCLMADQTIGSCLLFDQAGANGFYCVYPGSTAQECSTTATRSDLSMGCSLGFACDIGPGTEGFYGCDEECFPDAGPGDGCGTTFDVECIASSLDPRIGYCAYTNEGTSGTSGSIGTAVGTNGTAVGSNGVGTVGTSTNTGTSTGTGTSTHSTTASSGNTSSSSSGGACLPEFTPCSMTGGPSCGCGLACVYEPLRSGDVCEVPCTTTSQCPTAFTVCTGTSCTVNLCGIAIGGPPNGTLDGTCNAEGQGDGTCVGTTGPDGGVYGVCYQAGTAMGSGCSLTANRSDPGGLCAPNYFCGPTLTGGTNCYYLCDPADADCEDAGFKTCESVPQDPNVGYCQ